MNTTAEICAALLDNGPMDKDALEDKVGLSTKTCAAMLGNLAREGVVTWDTRTDIVSIAKATRAREIAEKASSRSTPAATDKAPALTAAMSSAPATTTTKKFLRDLLPTAIEIEKGIPIPPPGTGLRACPWPFGSMEIGDSFAIEAPPGMKIGALIWRLRSAAERWARKHQPAFRAATRMSDDGKSVRLWRAPDAPGAAAATTGNGLAAHIDPGLAARTSSLGMRSRRKAA